MKASYYLTIAIFLLISCENRDLNEGEAFKPREIHENISFSFDKITVDGVEYLILEKDNNNPHEGFGFMAFRANKLIEKQDTVLAYLRSLTEMNIRMNSTLTKRDISTVRDEFDQIFEFYLSEERPDLDLLEKADLKSTDNKSPEGVKVYNPNLIE
ncbi:MAG: hypothetical protein RIA69_21205 [Cyclobacteriaceae bacterium]